MPSEESEREIAAEVPVDEAPRSFTVRPPRRIWAATALVAANVGIHAAVTCAMLLPAASAFDFSWGGLWNFVSEFFRFEPSLTEVLRFGANHGPYVAQGEWWRLLTCAFVHIGVLHLLINMFALVSLRIVEGFYGSGAFLMIYLASALGGSIASLLWNPGVVSAGASGAIFGLAGALVAFFLSHKDAMPQKLYRPVMRNLMFLLALNLLLGLVPGIDIAAHVGGLVTGFAAGRLLDREIDRDPRLDLRRFARGAGVFVVLGGLCAFIPARARDVGDIRNDLLVDEALRAVMQSDLTKALELADRGLAEDPHNAVLLEVRAQARLAQGDGRGALADFDTLLQVQPDEDEARHARTFLRWSQGDGAGALADAEVLVEHRPDASNYRQLHGEILYSLERWPEAADDFARLAHAKGDSAMEGQLFLWLARQRMGQRDEAVRELAGYLKTPRFADSQQLEVAAGGLFAGRVSEDDFLRTYDRHDAAPELLTRLYFFAGSHRLVGGEPEGARELLRKAIERGTRAESTWMLAKAELERLRDR